jgi:predicted ester cyclase
MKVEQVVILLIAMLILPILAGCSQESAVSQMEEQNKALIRRIHAEVSNGNLEIFDEVLSPNYIRHCQSMPLELQEIHGTEVFKEFVTDFVNAVSNCKDEIDFIIADSNMVAYVTTTTGIQTGPIGNLAPSGKEFMLKNIVIQRIENGKVAETWISWDNVAMLNQLGYFPASTQYEP